MDLNNWNKEKMISLISKKKDNEQKAMSLPGISGGVLGVLLINIFINSLDELPKILTISNWAFKFIFVFSILIDFICGIFLIYHIIYPGNNKQLERYYKKVQDINKEFIISKTEHPNNKEYQKKIKTSRQKAISDLGLPNFNLAMKINTFYFLFLIALNFVMSILLFSRSDIVLGIIFFSIFILIIVANRPNKIIAIIFIIISSILLVIITLCRYPVNSIMNDFIIIKYTILICLFIIALSSIQIFALKYESYKFLLILDERITVEDLSEKVIRSELEKYFDIFKLDFFKKD